MADSCLAVADAQADRGPGKRSDFSPSVAAENGYGPKDAGILAFCGNGPEEAVP
jgi:hypothetical protein